MVAGLVLLSLLSFIAVIIGTAMGAGANDGFSSGIWPAVIMLPLIALPAAMLATIALLIVSAVNKSRENRNASA